jgi:AraC-like DNA-binding protein
MAMHAKADVATSRPGDRSSPASRGPTRREEYVRRVRDALNTDYAALHTSPLCELPGVVALARTQFSSKIFPTAWALRALLDRAYQAAIDELDGMEDRQLQQVLTYLHLAHEGKSVAAITRHLGLHSRSYVHREIQRQALELITEAFLKLARQHGDAILEPLP